jgi:hypothetical protein
VERKIVSLPTHLITRSHSFLPSSALLTFPSTAACSQRSVLFISLLGFLLQNIVGVASEFFAYQIPSIQDYAFLGLACLLLVCIKLLYVNDSSASSSDAQDHALMVNRFAGFAYNVGQFCLLLSTTVLGSGLNLLTHSYLAATAALPGPAKNLVCGGLSTALLSTLFLQSLHVKRVPTDPSHRRWFVLAYSLQSVVLLAVSLITGLMCVGKNLGGLLEYLMNSDIELLAALSAATLLAVVMTWMDHAIEATLYESAEDARAFRTYPYGFWCCLKADDGSDDEDMEAANPSHLQPGAARTGVSSLSVLSPLLGESVTNLGRSGMGGGYDSLTYRMASRQSPSPLQSPVLR